MFFESTVNLNLLRGKVVVRILGNVCGDDLVEDGGGGGSEVRERDKRKTWDRISQAIFWTFSDGTKSEEATARIIEVRIGIDSRDGEGKVRRDA